MMLLMFVVSARGVSAQQTVTGVLTFLLTNQGVDTGSTQRDAEAARSTSDVISRALLANIATLPVTSSSGAFVYRLNPELGTVERATRSFGPFFVERAATIGAHESAFGVTVQHMRFTSLDGHDLRDGSLVTTANQFSDEATPFDVDRIALKIDATVATLYANLGVADRMEIGAALPLVALRLDGTRVNTYRGRTFTQAAASATAIGPADMILRGKYTLFASHGSGVAAAVDLRLPTGREENLLGAGSMSARVAGIVSIESGPVTTHGNWSVAVGGLSREIGFGGAVAIAASDRLSLVAEITGRRIDGAGGIAPLVAANPRIPGVQTTRLVSEPGPLNALVAAPGVKWNIGDTWVLVANVGMPLTSAGLTSRLTPFIGLDYSMEW
jgi:hypothetical protein